MIDTHAKPEPYSSLDALRRANDEMVANLPEEASHSTEIERLAAEAHTAEFIRRAVETGTVLDLPMDRKVAQGLIDYWLPSTYPKSPDTEARQPLSARAETLLKPFDEKFMQSLAERSDAVVRGLDRDRGALARRILLRLMRFSDGSRRSSPKIRETLFSADDAVQGNAIVAQLQKAGTLVVTPTDRGDLVELRYEALIRYWRTLHDLIDERAKFRDAALYWVRTGKNTGALLNSRQLRKSAAEYSDQNELEREFLEESFSHARKRFLLISTFFIIFWIVSVPTAWLVYSDWIYPAYADSYLRDARSSAKPNDVRVKGIRWLAEHNEKVDLSSISLLGTQESFVDLKNLNAPLSKFANATLRNMDFEGASLPNSRFDDATLCDDSFAEANLSGSVFDRARLGRSDFSQANVNNASFQDVIYAANDPPKFKKTAWWLARGWDLQQVDLLAKEFGTMDPTIPWLPKELKRFEATVESSNPSVDRAIALDGKAWTLAIYGVELDQAEKASHQALDTIRGLKDIPVGLREAKEPLLEDTLGYILLIKGDPKQALTYLQPAAQAAAQTQNPAAIFRYALALHMSGQEDEALKQLTAAIDAGYLPSHELLLLRQHFSGEFKARLEERLAQAHTRRAGDQSQSKAPPPPCPVLQTRSKG